MSAWHCHRPRLCFALPSLHEASSAPRYAAAFPSALQRHCSTKLPLLRPRRCHVDAAATPLPYPLLCDAAAPPSFTCSALTVAASPRAQVSGSQFSVSVFILPLSLFMGKVTTSATQPVSQESSTYDEDFMRQSLLFDDRLKDLKNLRSQLYSAAEYFELSYSNDDQKQRVVETLKDYAIKALVNTVDHLGSVTYKVNDLLDEKVVEVSRVELCVSCIEQVCVIIPFNFR